MGSEFRPFVPAEVFDQSGLSGNIREKAIGINPASASLSHASAQLYRGIIESDPYPPLSNIDFLTVHFLFQHIDSEQPIRDISAALSMPEQRVSSLVRSDEVYQVDGTQWERFTERVLEQSRKQQVRDFAQEGVSALEISRALGITKKEADEMVLKLIVEKDMEAWPYHIHLLVPNALSLLNPHLQKIAQPAYTENKSYVEIAASLLLTEGTVNTGLYKARAIIEMHLEQFGFKRLIDYSPYIQKAVRKDRIYPGEKLAGVWYTTDQAIRTYRDRTTHRQALEAELDGHFPAFAKLKSQNITQQEIMRLLDVTDYKYRLLRKRYESTDVEEANAA